MITLRIRPGVSYSWKLFTGFHNPYSIALDGYVNESTKRDLVGPYANFDHHAQVDRLVARSTCEQVYTEINMGLFDIFRKDGIPTAQICINDCDEDTCLAIWLLMNHEQVIGNACPAINRLVYCEDRLDSTGGAYPMGDKSIIRKMAWIFDPYNQARYSERLKNLDAEGMRTIVEAVCSRISRYVIDGGEELPLNGQYERLGGGSDWALVKETGPAARKALYAYGIKAFVSLVGNHGCDNVYSIGRWSPWTKFNMKRIMKALNKEEHKDRSRRKCNWGPIDENATIGGSPRDCGSRLSPDEVAAIVEENK